SRTAAQRDIPRRYFALPPEIRPAFPDRAIEPAVQGPRAILRRQQCVASTGEGLLLSRRKRRLRYRGPFVARIVQRRATSCAARQRRPPSQQVSIKDWERPPFSIASPAERKHAFLPTRP